MTGGRLQSLAFGALLVVLCPVSAEAQFDEFGCGISCDGYASYQGQSTCKSSPQPGVAEFRDLVLDSFPTTTDLGIMRGCSVGGQSEHKEGRAWDWGVLATQSSQKAIAEGVLDALLDTDGCGNKHALARRFGIMYMIWNKKIWRAYKASSGWLPYAGSNPHTDHVHFSFSWAGAKENTSYFTNQGTPPEEEQQPVCNPAPVAGAGSEPFEDMPKGSFGYAEAKLLLEAGITNGCKSSPKLFCPSCPTNRYSAVVFLLRAMGADVSNPPATPSFSDVPKSKWFYPYVEKAKKLGMTSGCGDGKFCPYDATTRAQMAKFIVHATGWKTVSTGQSFADVEPGDWFYKSVETIKANCVTNGCGNGTNYCPGDVLSRAAAAIFVARAFDLGNKNSCLDYCDPSLCAEGAWCEQWTTCSGFASQCDETGTRSRTCHDFASCSATSTDPDCGETSTTETQSCKRNTDGKVVDGWGPWSACGGFDGPCDESGTRTRKRKICADGKSTTDTQTQGCMRDTDGKVLSDWTVWTGCGGFDDECDPTGTQERSREVCEDGMATTDTEIAECETTTPDCTDGTDATDGTGSTDGSGATDGTDATDGSGTADGTDGGEGTDATDSTEEDPTPDGTDAPTDGTDGPESDGSGGTADGTDATEAPGTDGTGAPEETDSTDGATGAADPIDGADGIGPTHSASGRATSDGCQAGGGGSGGAAVLLILVLGLATLRMRRRPFFS